MESIDLIIEKLNKIEKKLNNPFNNAPTPKGVEKKIDNLGRVTLPINIRREFDIEDGSKLKVYTLGDKIILEKSE